MVKVIAPTGVLGIGFSYRSFRQALEHDVDVIGCDAGSTDWGPYHLGSGISWAGRDQTRRDLEILMQGALERKIPLLVGTAGFSGGEPALQWTRDIVLDIARQHDMSFELAIVHSEVDAAWLGKAIDEERVKALDGVDELTRETAGSMSRAVAMMGPEPFQRALAQGADIVIAGRSSDAAVYASVPLQRGINPAMAWHVGKLIECANAISEPVSAGACIVATVDDDQFVVQPTLDGVRCTTNLVAAHMLYENSSPYQLREPPGTLDTTDAVYEQLTDDSVRVSGSRFIEQPYSVRVEGVALEGYRSMCLAGLRDPVVISEVDDYTSSIASLLAKSAPRRFGVGPDDYELRFRRYGLDAVLGPRAAKPRAVSDDAEVGLVLEVIARDRELAHQLVASTLPYLMHGVHVRGTKRSANAALAYSPAVIDLGPAYRWTVWHAVTLDDPLQPFPMELEHVGDAS